jgi:hypothetical protein
MQRVNDLYIVLFCISISTGVGVFHSMGHKVENAEFVKKLFILSDDSILSASID